MVHCARVKLIRKWILTGHSGDESLRRMSWWCSFMIGWFFFPWFLSLDGPYVHSTIHTFHFSHLLLSHCSLSRRGMDLSHRRHYPRRLERTRETSRLCRECECECEWDFEWKWLSVSVTESDVTGFEVTIRNGLGQVSSSWHRSVLCPPLVM